MTKDEVLALPTVDLVFKYITIQGNKISYTWGADVKDFRTYNGEKGRNVVEARPGMIYRFPEQERAIYPGNATYVGEWPNQEDVELWATQHRANQQLVAAQKEVSKALKTDVLRKHTSALHQMYWSLNAPQRAQFLAWLVKEITYN